MNNNGQINDIASMIDHTLLKPEATEEQIKKLCHEAKRYGFASVCVNPCYVSLAAKEFELLTFLATNAGQVFTKEQLFSNVWGYEDYGDINTVTVHIRRLREKIEINPSNPKYIITVWGVGYKFQEEKI